MPKYSWPELSPDSLPFLCFAYGDLSKSGDFLPLLLLNVWNLFSDPYFNGHFDCSRALLEAEDQEWWLRRAQGRLTSRDYPNKWQKFSTGNTCLDWSMENHCKSLSSLSASFILNTLCSMAGLLRGGYMLGLPVGALETPYVRATPQLDCIWILGSVGWGLGIRIYKAPRCFHRAAGLKTTVQKSVLIESWPRKESQRKTVKRA